MQTGSGKVTGEGQRSRWRLGWERIGQSHTRLCIYTTTTDAQCTSGTDQWNTFTVSPKLCRKLFPPWNLPTSLKLFFSKSLYIDIQLTENGCIVSFCAFFKLSSHIKPCGLPFSSLRVLTTVYENFAWPFRFHCWVFKT